MTPILGTIASSYLQATNSYESIASYTVTSGGSTVIDFTSIPSTYKHLQLRYFATQGSNGSLYLTFNNNSTGTNYSRVSMYGDGGSCGTDNPGLNQNNIDIQCSGNSSYFGVGVLDIYNYTSTTITKNLRNIMGRDLNGSGLCWFNSGMWRTTSDAITRITLTPDVNSGGAKQYSSYALYGIKGQERV